MLHLPHGAFISNLIAAPGRPFPPIFTGFPAGEEILHAAGQRLIMIFHNAPELSHAKLFPHAEHSTARTGRPSASASVTTVLIPSLRELHTNTSAVAIHG